MATRCGLFSTIYVWFVLYSTLRYRLKQLELETSFFQLFFLFSVFLKNDRNKHVKGSEASLQENS